MRYLKFCLIVVGVIAASYIFSACQNVRLITALVKTIDVANIADQNLLIQLIGNENLLPAEQAKADDLRNDTVRFGAVKEKDLEIYGDLGGDFTVYMLAVSKPSDTSTFPLPVEMAIYTTSAHKVGDSVTNGYAEIRFGDGGPTYTTNLADTYFKFKIASVSQENGDNIAVGTFSFIARNKDDAADTKRLIVMDGNFITRIK